MKAELEMRRYAVFGILFALSFSVALAGDTNVFLDEDFSSLERWSPLTFESVPRHSEYRVAEIDDGTGILEMSSDNAGSALILNESFDPREFPIIEWRWKVEKDISTVDHSLPRGDDYAIRIYAFFEYTGDGLSLGERIRSAAYRSLRGTYPPHSGIAFVWTRIPVAKRIFPNPYTDRVAMVVQSDQNAELGQWAVERIDILETYRECFGHDPPATPMRLAIMTDSDDSGQKTEATVDWLRILADEE